MGVRICKAAAIRAVKYVVLSFMSWTHNVPTLETNLRGGSSKISSSCRKGL
jgi:hypothetical protein